MLYARLPWSGQSRLYMRVAAQAIYGAEAKRLRTVIVGLDLALKGPFPLFVKCAGEYQNCLIRKVALIPNATPETFHKGFI